MYIRGVEDVRDAMDAAVYPLVRSAFAVMNLGILAIHAREEEESSSDVLSVYVDVLNSAEGQEKLEQVKTCLEQARTIVSPFGVEVKRFDQNAANALSVLRDLRTNTSVRDRVRLGRLRDTLFAMRKLYQSHAFSQAGNATRWALAELIPIVEQAEQYVCDLLGESFEELPVPDVDLSPDKVSLGPIKPKRRSKPGLVARVWSWLKSIFKELLALAAPLLALKWLLSTLSLTWEWVPCLPPVESWSLIFAGLGELVLCYRTYVRPLAEWLVSLFDLSFTLSDGWKDVLIGTVMSFGVASRRAEWEKAKALSEPHKRLGTLLRWLRDATFSEALRLLPHIAKLTARAAAVLFDWLLILYYLPIKKLAERPIARSAKLLWRKSEDAMMIPAGPYEPGYPHTLELQSRLLWWWVFPTMFTANVFLQLTIKVAGLIC